LDDREFPPISFDDVALRAKQPQIAATNHGFVTDGGGSTGVSARQRALTLS